MLTTTARNADLGTIAEILKTQRARAVDLIIPGSQMRFRDGNLVVSGQENVLSEEGFLNPNGSFRPTVVADEGLSDKLGIPAAFLRDLRNGVEKRGKTTRPARPDLIDANLNGLLRGKYRSGPEGPEEVFSPESRSFLARLLVDDEGVGVLRALLSPRYKVLDNFDALLALLDGLRESGVNAQPEIDLTERRMVVRVTAPEIVAYAPELLEGYVSPYGGQRGSDLPIVEAGFVFSNSEVGGGAWSLTPQMRVQICKNGLTITKDASRTVHLGGAQDDGIVNYGEDTIKKSLEVVTLRTRDAVKTFLDVEYMQGALADLTAKAGKEVKGSEAPQVIKTVGQRLGFDKTQQEGILDFFLNGGQQTAGGLMQAVTAYAQAEDVTPDQRFDLENQATKVLDLV